MGSNFDVYALRTRFAELEFFVRVFENLSVREIRRKIEHYSSKDHSNYEMFGLALLTHGTNDGWVYARDQRIKLDEFIEPFKPATCPGLFQKPKVFIIQACRGSQTDPGVVFRSSSRDWDDSYRTWPLDADILIHYATGEGRFAWRNKKRGSWFIQGIFIIIIL